MSNQQLEHLQELELNKDYSTKAVFDHIHALSDCYETQADWIIIFEDDILLADGLFAKTKQAVQSFSEDAKDDMLFMRLFNQERSTGWGSREVGGNHELSLDLNLIGGLCDPHLLVQTISNCSKACGRWDSLDCLYLGNTDFCCIVLPGRKSFHASSASWCSKGGLRLLRARSGVPESQSTSSGRASERQTKWPD